MAKKYFVLDTNVLLHDPGALVAFAEARDALELLEMDSVQAAQQMGEQNAAAWQKVVEARAEALGLRRSVWGRARGVRRVRRGRRTRMAASARGPPS